MHKFSIILLSASILFLSGCTDENDTQTQSHDPIIVKESISSLSVEKVNRPPVAKTETFKTLKDSTYNGELKAEDSDGDEITFIMIEAPRHGSVTLDIHGCFTYTPKKGYKGEDSFSYKAKDETTACPAKVVTIMIEDTAISLPKPITSLKAKELTTSQVTLYWEDTVEDKTAYLLYKEGKLHCEVNKNKKQITLTNLKSDTNYTFTLKTKNQAGASQGRDVTITTKDVTSKPQAPTNLKVLAQEDNSIRLGWKDNADNESAYEIYQGGKLLKTISTNCSCTVIQHIQKEQTVTFEVRAKNRLGSSSGAILTINKKPIIPVDPNTAPTLKAQTLTTQESKLLKITLVASDKENDTLRYIITKQPTNATLTGTAPNLTYTANANFIGSDSIEVKANDGKLDSEIVTIMIEVTGKPVEVIYGHTLPPEPDPKINNSTLLGVDSNGNGVRDDVERWVIKTLEHGEFQNNLYVTDKFLQKAKNHQKRLANEDPTPQEVLKLYTEELDNLDCLFTALIIEGKDEKEKELTIKFRDIVYNTHERLENFFLYENRLPLSEYYNHRNHGGTMNELNAMDKACQEEYMNFKGGK